MWLCNTHSSAQPHAAPPPQDGEGRKTGGSPYFSPLLTQPTAENSPFGKSHLFSHGFDSSSLQAKKSSIHGAQRRVSVHRQCNSHTRQQRRDTAQRFQRAHIKID